MKKVILVTDGDEIAKAAVERAAQNLNLRTISVAGNPTPFAREDRWIRFWVHLEVVVVMCEIDGKSEGSAKNLVLGERSPG